MNRLKELFGAVALATAVFGWAAGAAAAASMEEFTAALDKIKTYDYPQNREPLSAVSRMVNAVGESPGEKRLFAAKMATLLGADASEPCKAFLCRQLAIIGSEEQVASLSPLLVDERYSDMARYALERIGGEKTSAAMRAALAKTSGRTQIGLINSLGVLGDKPAVRSLAGLANGPEASVAAAAVAALGKIGGAEAQEVLNALSGKAKGGFLDDVYDAYLACADQLAATNKPSQAVAIYQSVYAKSSSLDIRTIALRGMVAASGDGAVRVILKVLRSDDMPMQAVAVSLAGTIPGPKATAAFARKLPELPPEVQVKMLAMLGFRGDRAALPEVVKAAKTAVEPVRVAALETLGDLGDSSTVRLLAEAGVSGESASSRSARESLYRLSGRSVDGQIVHLLADDNRPVQAELLRAVAKRKVVAAVPALIKLASGPHADLRPLALQALGRVANGDTLPVLVDLMVNAQTAADRAAAQRAVVAVAGKTGRGSDSTQAIRESYSSARDTVVKVALLQALGEIGDDSSLPFLEKAVTEPDKTIAHAAVSALAGWPTPGPLSLLQKYLQTADDNSTRTLALSGFIRLIGLEEGRGAAHTLALYREALQRCSRPDEKKAVLAGLAGVKTTEAVKLVAVCLEDESLRNEAAVALSLIACPQKETDPGLRGPEVIGALERAAARSGSAEVRKRIEDYLSTMPENEGGFVSMFNGQDLAGWQGSDFAVTNGVLVCHGHHGGYLAYTKTEFTNFVMRFEVKLSPGANNGLNFRTDGAVWNEIQILDDTHPTFTNIHPYQAHGSIYGVVPAKRGQLKPAGQWNYQEVTADGSHLQVRLNGTVIVDADLSKVDLAKCLDGTAHPGLRRTSGGIGWLGHLNGYEQAGPVFFRNIRIKTLP